jgi:hypothetical protein
MHEVENARAAPNLGFISDKCPRSPAYNCRFSFTCMYLA